MKNRKKKERTPDLTTFGCANALIWSVLWADSSIKIIKLNEPSVYPALIVTVGFSAGFLIMLAREAWVRIKMHKKNRG